VLLDLLLPARCPGCGASGSSPCRACVAGLRPPPAGPAPLGLDACVSLFAYEAVGRLIVTALKYRRDRAALGWLADGLAGLLAPAPGTVVTWAPTTAARRRQRGFDQSELLARALGRRWGVPCRPLLARKAGPPQTGRSLADRLEGPILLARAGSRSTAEGAPVVVVDDVLTTGATLTAAARALRAVDVAAVVGITAARTPQRVNSPPSVFSLPPVVQEFAQVAGATGR
jgi:predicted amidophosphoribosyltransferase